MLSQLSEYQKSLLAAYWALCDAQPPKKSERMALEYTKQLFDLSKSTRKYPRSAFDGRIGNSRHPLGHNLPKQRKVRAS